MSDTKGNDGRDIYCDECGGIVKETAAGRECEDCHKRFNAQYQGIEEQR